MKKLFFMLFLAACTSKNINNNVLEINMDVTYDEFKILLKEYDKYQSFPNIDK